MVIVSGWIYRTFAVCSLQIRRKATLITEKPAKKAKTGPIRVFGLKTPIEDMAGKGNSA